MVSFATFLWLRASDPAGPVKGFCNTESQSSPSLTLRFAGTMPARDLRFFARSVNSAL